MLVLTRKVGEEIVIGDDIHVVVVGLRGNQIRLGVTAPASVSIDRSEVRIRRCAALAAENTVNGTWSSIDRPDIPTNR